MTVHMVDGLQLRVDRGPNWLIVKLRPDDESGAKIPPKMADELWSISSRHFIYRLVLEMDEFESLPSGFFRQLAKLQERLGECGGALRLCGLSPKCERALHKSRLDATLPNRPTRVEAVMGSDVLSVPH